MPNLKKLLIDKGTTFDESFVSNSLCCSRATILHSTPTTTRSSPTSRRSGASRIPLPRPRELHDRHLGQGAGLQDGLLRQVFERVQRHLHPPGLGRVVRGDGQLPEPHLQRERPHGRLRSGNRLRHRRDLGQSLGLRLAHGGRRPAVLYGRQALPDVDRHQGPHQPATPAPRDENAYPDVTCRGRPTSTSETSPTSPTGSTTTRP